MLRTKTWSYYLVLYKVWYSPTPLTPRKVKCVCMTIITVKALLLARPRAALNSTCFSRLSVSLVAVRPS